MAVIAFNEFTRTDIVTCYLVYVHIVYDKCRTNGLSVIYFQVKNTNKENYCKPYNT